MVNRKIRTNNFSKNKSNCIFVSILLLALVLVSFVSKNPEQKTISRFQDITHKIDTLDRQEKIQRFGIEFEGEVLFLELNEENQTSTLTIDELSVPTDFNFFYDHDIESSLEEIKILKSISNEDFIVIFPMTTEEFATFQLLKFDSQLNAVEKSVFEINTHKYDNVREFYLNNKIDLILKKDEFKLKMNGFRSKGRFDEIKNTSNVE